MTKLIEATSRAQAWVRAADLLLREGPALNIVLDIRDPATEGKGGLAAVRSLNRLYLEENQMPINAVAETIFPAWEYIHRGAVGVFEEYPKQYEVLRKGDPQRWGTYAGRFLVGRDREGNRINPLEILVAKMRNIHNGSGGKSRSCYELGILDDAPYLEAYDGAVDANRRRGGPCLMHVSFKLVDSAVHLTALYRNHDYRYKVPGNLLGLARLQAFVASEVGAAQGGLVVHSTHAFLASGKGKTRLRQVTREVGEAIDDEN